MERGRSHARMMRSSGTGSGWLARNRSTRSARVAAGTWLMAGQAYGHPMAAGPDWTGRGVPAFACGARRAEPT